MAKEPEVTEQQQAEAAPVEKKEVPLMKKILIIGVPVFILQIAVVYFLIAKFVFPATTSVQPALPAAAPKAPPVQETQQIYVVKDLIVNPAGTNGTRFLLATVGFELSSADAVQELQKKEVQVRDILNTILMSKDLSSLVNADEKENLRKEISEKVGEMVKTGSLSKVYFSKFIIQ